MTNSKLILKDGKFYRDGVHVPLEFGNKEQIELIKLVKQLRRDGSAGDFIMEQDGSFKCSIFLDCVCGSLIHLFWEPNEDPVGKKLKCEGCNFIYQMMYNEDDSWHLKVIN